jgi:hypothetical protein
MPLQIMTEKIGLARQKTNFARFAVIAGVLKNLWQQASICTGS